jgi:CheY-like chemotaxis protein
MKESIILLVEDDPDDEMLTMRALTRNKIANQIIVAHDGAEALELLLGDSPNTISPTVVLLDIKLPKIDGLQVLSQIRSHEKTKWTPVVILTSSKEDRDIIESYRLGCNSYVRKPVRFEEFIEAVQNLGLYWMLLNEAMPEGSDSK